jgi:hypothetical protein
MSRMVDIESIISISVGAATTIIALFALRYASQSVRYSAKSYMRVRRTEEVRLVETILKDVTDQIVEYDLAEAEAPVDSDGEVEPSYKKKLYRMLDHALATLNWFAYLVKAGEIEDLNLVNYFRVPVVQWYETLFVPNMPDLTTNSKLYEQFHELYRKFKKEIDEERERLRQLRSGRENSDHVKI